MTTTMNDQLLPFQRLDVYQAATAAWRMRNAAVWRGDASAAFASPGRSAALPHPTAAAAKPALALPSSKARRETGCRLARSGFGGSTM